MICLRNLLEYKENQILRQITVFFNEDMPTSKYTDERY